jgi:hypothetical protein
MAKHSKHGRNKVKCQAYRANDTRAKNKARKLLRILKGFRKVTS